MPCFSTRDSARESKMEIRAESIQTATGGSDCVDSFGHLSAIRYMNRSRRCQMLKKTSFLVTAALLFALHPLLAQQDTGVITGEVLDASGVPIGNASVEVKNTETGIVLRVSTGIEG